ncbi:terminal uridylyltransferase Tailor [Teleopsis dalmanni]|uniref:terminal uridylyltransferase Tailor n=1 Tax=Teleopsis dalmanni TaxID=139649 RepID=UPI0018CF2194|nr:terminal uridylyltransferase Tailor [Teleopsis dalmanni]
MAAKSQWLHPLTLEADIFLTALKQYAQNETNAIDNQLCEKFQNIIDEIQCIVSSKTSNISETTNLQFVKEAHLKAIQRIFHCKECNRDLGKTASGAAVHLIDVHKKKETTVQPKTTEKQEENVVVKLPKKIKGLLRKDLNNLFNQSVMEAELLKISKDYEVIAKDLLDDLKPVFPDEEIKFYKFGSRISGIGNRNSDLDIYIDIGNSFKVFDNSGTPTILNKLNKTNNALAKNQKSWHILRTISQARVPIIRVSNKSTGIDCDLGFSNSLGFCNTQLLDYIFTLQPLTRRMCIFLKKWLGYCDVEISTYSVCLMVIYSLQLAGHLPSIKALQEETDTPVNVGPWAVHFSQKPLKEWKMEKLSIESNSCKKFIDAFFKLYSVFNYGMYAISPYLGTRVTVSQITSEMPTSYTNYVNETKNSLETKAGIVLQDPFQLNHNTTKHLSPFQLKRLKSYFKLSAEHISMKN